MEWDIVPYWFEVMILNSIIWAGDNAAPANFPRYEKEKIAGGITLCVVRGEAAATASDVVASLSRWLFAFQLLLVLLLLCFSYFLFVFQRLILLLLLLLALFVFARSRRPGFSPAELWLAVGAGEDDACLVPLGWGGLPRPGWLWASRERGRGRAEDYFIGRVAQCNQTLKSFIPWRDINHLKSVTVWQNDFWHQSKTQCGSLVMLLAIINPLLTMLENV